VIKKQGEVISKGGGYIGFSTNNIAEYSALIEGLSEVLKLGYKEVVILGDSQLVINQINKKWEVKDSKLKPLFEKAIKLLENFVFWEAKWIPRNQNKETDLIANTFLQNK
jgi:ribonuclease HI